MQERIQYLTKKAQHGLITDSERYELARLLGRNPNDFQNDNGLSQLIGIALVAIAIAIIADLLSRRT
jgi:hypothetical protein